MRRLAVVWIVPLILLAHCTRDRATRCGRCDNHLWAGAAAVPITPRVEAFTDLNANDVWDTGEPFTDTNGNGRFDPVWIAGFGSGRLAVGVHDDLWARALVLEYNARRVVFVAVDLIGYMANHVMDAKNLIRDRTGYLPEEVVICSTHTHEGPDTMGRWGPNILTTGLNKEYLAFVAGQVAGAIGSAKDRAVRARVAFGAEEVPDVPDVLENGGALESMETPAAVNRFFPGRVDILRDGGGPGNYGRDPLIVDRTLLAMRVVRDDSGEGIATLINFAAHPEILGGRNHLLSSDFPHYLRTYVEESLGGIAMFVPGALGGMMTPQVGGDTFSEADRIGGILAHEVVNIVGGARAEDIHNLRVEWGYGMFPLDNRTVVDLARQFGIMDIPEDRLVYSFDQCKDRYGCREEEVAPCREYATTSSGRTVMKGCAPFLIQAIAVGDAVMIGVPGELFPELANGLPGDFAPYDPLPSRPNKYFPQHNSADPLSRHVSPYDVPPGVRTYMKGPYRFILGLANNEGGYILPEADFNEQVDIFTESGDHYEETESPGKSSAPVFMKKAVELLSRIP